MARQRQAGPRVTLRYLQARRVTIQTTTRLLEMNRNRIVDQGFDFVYPEVLLQRFALCARHYEEMMDMSARIIW